MSENIKTILKNGDNFIYKMNSDKNGRFKSWEYCYSIFSEYKCKELTEKDLDLLCLHLSFYLASWGMYRGSSFLLQKDYKIHGAAIKELLRKEYADLWAISCESYINDKNKPEKLFALKNKLKEIYGAIRESANNSINRKIPEQSVSDTLITKILLGTLGCVPAYDRYFNSGLKICRVASACFSPGSICDISKFYIENTDHLENWRYKISRQGIEYPQMKIIDMCFWQIGYDGFN